LAAEKSTATLGPEEVLKAGPALERLSGQAGWIFWVVLGLVVAGLLAILARLLPKSSRTEPGPASGSDSTKESR
jgi:hypothetical protein